jgi:hypothetical protein
MTRIITRRVPGYYANQAGTVTQVNGGTLWLDSSRSDIVKTEEHKAWLLDKNVWLRPTPYQAEIYSHSFKQALVVNPSSGQSWAGCIDFYGPPERFAGIPNTSGITAQAVLKVREKIKDQDVNFGAALAEGAKSVNMIASAAKTLARASESFRTGDYAGAFNAFGREYDANARRAMRNPRNRTRIRDLTSQERVLTNRWLELQFGWKPLLSDIDGAANHLAKRATSNPTAFRFKADATVAKPYQPVIYSVDNGNPVFIRHDQFNKGRKGVRYVVWYSLINRNAAQAAANGLLDIGPTLWELTPWSFVIDWVYPIGPFLSTLTATAGKEFLAGTKTDFTVLSAKRTSQVVRSNPPGFVDTTGSYLRYISMDRVILSDFPTPELPRLRNPFSVTHALDALALLAGRTRGLAKLLGGSKR